jgi:hypothetical protein
MMKLGLQMTEESMRRCHHRRTLLDVCMGTYSPKTLMYTAESILVLIRTYSQNPRVVVQLECDKEDRAYIDTDLLEIIMHNAIGNACMHGEHRGPVSINIDIQDCLLVVTINNKRGVHHTTLLSRLNHNKDSWWKLKSTGGKTSYNLGLTTIQRCANAGGYMASLEATTDSVIFRIQSPVIEKDIHDMSPIHIKPDTYLEEDIHTKDNSKIVIYALDDVDMVRRLITRMLSSLVGNIEYRVRGKTDKQVRRFTNDVIEASPPVDIVILDNILSSRTQSVPTVYGLDIASELVQRGFSGRIVMSSGDDLIHCYTNMPKDDPFSTKCTILNRMIKETIEGRKYKTCGVRKQRSRYQLCSQKD